MDWKTIDILTENYICNQKRGGNMRNLIDIAGSLFLLLALPFLGIGLALNKIPIAIEYAFDLWDESNCGKAIVSVTIIIISLILIQLLNSIYAFSIDIHNFLLESNIIISSKIIRHIFIIGMFFTAFFSMKQTREAIKNSDRS